MKANQFISPEGYHGAKKRTYFFEGWYFKVTNASATETFAFIPGIFYGKELTEHHAFLQVLEGEKVQYSYLSFPTAQFSASKEQLAIQVNNSTFSQQEIVIHETKENGECVEVQLTYEAKSKWDGTVFQPGSMGFFNYLPMMECYMHTCLMYGRIKGHVQIGGKRVDMTGGSLYIEKNWGRSFPKAWVWVQAASFAKTAADPAVSLSCSVGKVPMLGATFDGFLIGLTIGSTLYDFTTHNLSKVTLDLRSEIPQITVRNRRYCLKIHVKADPETFMLCRGPQQNGVMVPFVRESLQGEVEITLVERKTSKVVFAGVSQATGVELTNRELFDK